MPRSTEDPDHILNQKLVDALKIPGPTADGNGATAEPVKPEPCTHEQMSITSQAVQAQQGLGVRFSACCAGCKKDFVFQKGVAMTSDRKAVAFGLDIEGEERRVILPGDGNAKGFLG